MTSCSICLEENDMQIYTLPECNHSFHTNCILAWFRKGNKSCPLCKDQGVECVNYATNKLVSLLTISQTKYSPKCLKSISNDYLEHCLKVIKYKEEINEMIKGLNKRCKNMKRKLKKMNEKTNIFKEQILSYNIEKVIVPVKHIFFSDEVNST